jgi:methionine-S-sulfoxide reductase
MNIAIFAAGCFWGVQYYFDQVPGVIETEVGYIGGTQDNPTYEDVCYKGTYHAEAVKITFDPEQVSYKTLLKQFFRMHDPTLLNRQGPDVGDQYRSAIFYLDEDQKNQAEAMIKSLSKEEPIATSVEKAATFWKAEDYHQKYTEKTGRGMCHIPYKAV